MQRQILLAKKFDSKLFFVSRNYDVFLRKHLYLCLRLGYKSHVLSRYLFSIVYAKANAMAFDRTERFVKRATSTSARIGPGIYDISDLSKPIRDPGNL